MDSQKGDEEQEQEQHKRWSNNEKQQQWDMNKQESNPMVALIPNWCEWFTSGEDVQSVSKFFSLNH